MPNQSAKLDLIRKALDKIEGAKVEEVTPDQMEAMERYANATIPVSVEVFYDAISEFAVAQQKKPKDALAAYMECDGVRLALLHF